MSSNRMNGPKGTVLYFAYGSNLDPDRMSARCAGARLEARGVLRNHTLAFGGFSHQWAGAVATALPARGCGVAGVLYRMTCAELRVLDRYEGVPFSYERALRFVVDEFGRVRRAYVYLQPAVGFEPWAPAAAYAAVIDLAYARLGFDRVALMAATRTGAPVPRTIAVPATVFVYGTLLAGEANHRLLARARCLGAATTRPGFELRDLGRFPGMVRGGGRAIVGEVYAVDDPTLVALDLLEGHPSFYRRTRIALSDGATVDTYLLRRDQVRGRPVIETNNWRTRRMEQRT